MNKYSIIEADVESDKNEIISILQKADWNESYDSSKFEWKYLNVPYGKARCWFAIDNSLNSIVGISSLFPRKMFIDKKSVSALTLGDFYIEKKYRCFGPAFLLQRKIFSELKEMKTKQFIYGMANKPALGILEKIGYNNIGALKQYIKPLHLSNIAEYEEQYPKIFQNRKFRKAFDALFNVISKERYYKKRNNYTIEIQDYFDSRFDVLWRKAIQGSDIISERSLKMLNWRYVNNPTEDFKIFCMNDNNNNLIGYIVYNKNKNNNHQIFDVFYLKNRYNLTDLLFEFSKFSRKNNISAIMLYYFNDNNFLKKLSMFNFFSFQHEEHNLIISPIFLNSYEKNITYNQLNWHLLLGDKY